MAQYHYLLLLLNQSNNKLEKMESLVPSLEKKDGGYFIPVQYVQRSKYINDGGYDLKDFYGYLLEANEHGEISNATLYKP